MSSGFNLIRYRSVLLLH